MYGKDTEIENLIRERDHWMENARGFRQLADELGEEVNSIGDMHNELLNDFRELEKKYFQLKEDYDGLKTEFDTLSEAREW